MPQLIMRIQTVDFIHKLWAPRPLITTGGYTRESGLRTAETGQIIGYGAAFLANVSSLLVGCGDAKVWRD